MLIPLLYLCQLLLNHRHFRMVELEAIQLKLHNVNLLLAHLTHYLVGTSVNFSMVQLLLLGLLQLFLQCGFLYNNMGNLLSSILDFDNFSGYILRQIARFSPSR